MNGMRENSYDEILVSGDEESDMLHAPASSSDDLTRFGIVSSPQSVVNPGENMNTFEEGEPSVTKKRKHEEDEVREYSYAYDQSKQQTEKRVEVDVQDQSFQKGKRDVREDTVKESEASNQYKQPQPQPRPRDHDRELDEDMREEKRQKIKEIKEKLNALKELIPNCTTMMSLGTSFAPIRSPMVVLQQPRQNGVQVQLPTATLPFPQTTLPGGITGGMGMPALFPSLNYTSCQIGLPNQCFLPASATLRVLVPGGIQSPGIPMDWMQRFYALASAIQGQSSTRNQTTAIVQPNREATPQVSRDMDYESSHSTSGEWSSSSNPK